jgi:membrane protease YdiL (CAAX protease family)
MASDEAAVLETEARSCELATEKRRRWFELALVLLVALSSPLFSAIYILATGARSTSGLSPNVRWSYDFVHEATSLLLLGYVLRRRGLGFESLGLRWSLRDMLVAIPLAIVSYLAYAFAYRWISYICYLLFLSGPAYRAASTFFGHPGWLAIPFALFNPFFEELTVRAYLMTEVAELTGSATLAVAASVTVQAAYHLYYGWLGALSLAFQFLVFSLYYARWRRALPVVAAHGIFDLWAIARLMR